MKLIVDNLAIEYTDNGNGPVILLLHGWKDSLRTFDRVLELLVAGGYRVVRVDLPGFGQSEVPTTAWSVGDYSSFVAHFIQKLGIKAEYLVGHSFGGRVIIKGVSLNVLAPKNILIASGGISKSKTIRSLIFQIVAKIGGVISFIPPFIFFRHQLRNKLYQSAGSDYMGADSLKETYLKTIQEDLQAAASTILVPTLLVWGSEDTETPLADGQVFHKAIKESKLLVIPNAGHFVHQEAATQVADAIKQFISNA